MSTSTETGSRPGHSPNQHRRHPTASAADTFVPVPDYDRNPAIGSRTCPDCQAAPGEPCHWACSSRWN